MGRAISYCYLCSSQVREEAFAQGKAYRFHDRVCCAGCAPQALKSLPAELVQALLKEISGTRPPPPPPGRRASGSSIPALPAARPAPASKAPWIAGGAAVAVAGLVAAVALSGSPSPPPAAAPAKPPPARPRAVVDTPQREALRKAQAYAREKPDDFDGRIRDFEAVVLMGGSTEEGREAMRAIELLRARNREAVALGMAELERAMAEPLSRRDFGGALTALGAVRSRRLGTQWQLALDKREREIREAGAAAFAPLLAEGESARRSGDTARLDAVRAKVVALGLPRHRTEFDAAMAAIPAPPSFLVIEDFERGHTEHLKYVGGEEFPGAKGSFEPDQSSVKNGTTAYKLTADFTGGGMYVGFWRSVGNLHGQDVREIRFWAKTTTIGFIGVRIADGTGQVHQKKDGLPLARTSDWQEVVIRVSEVVGGERWAGANDGRWHPPCLGFGINVGHNVLVGPTKRGEMWIDDVRLILGPAGK